MRQHPLGIYEKALPKDLSWPERLVLAKSCGFDFVEMSVDETDERLSRLDWSTTQRASLVEAMLETGVAIPSMCLSAHRRFPFGSRDETVRERAREMGMRTLREDGMLKVASGMTSLREVLQATMGDAD